MAWTQFRNSFTGWAHGMEVRALSLGTFLSTISLLLE
jgi:hypothetical protein